MDSKLREIKIQEQISRGHCSTKRMSYGSEKSKDMKAYDINVDYLVFNQYNGRIGTFVKTYEKQYGKIDAETPEGEEKIINFLWKSKENRNKETLIDIKEKGQLEIGIVTKDGVVIDGNRRCMLLKRIAKEEHSSPTYFRAVVLDDTLNSNPKEIRKLETIYQMGVDEKVDYNAIEKYLKCRDLFEEDGFTLEEIAKMMGEIKVSGKPNIEKIQEYLDILKLMEEYLDTYKYNGMYTRLSEEKVEGPFVDVRNYLETHSEGKRIQGRDWQPDNDDISDLKTVYFDYIRAGFGTHKIRDIGNPSKGQGFFNHGKLWKEFISRYEEKLEPINENEKPLSDLMMERPEENIEDIIKARDKDWQKIAEPLLKENLGKCQRELEDIKDANQPIELLQRAKKTLEQINTDSETFDESILDMVKEINSILWDFQKIIKKK